jgi:hypothetical protein
MGHFIHHIFGQLEMHVFFFMINNSANHLTYLPMYDYVEMIFCTYKSNMHYALQHINVKLACKKTLCLHVWNTDICKCLF